MQTPNNELPVIKENRMAKPGSTMENPYSSDNMQLAIIPKKDKKYHQYNPKRIQSSPHRSTA